MAHIQFESTVNLGHVLTMAAFLLSAGIAYGSVKSDMNTLEWRLRAVERTIADLGLAHKSTADSLWVIKEDLAAIRVRVEKTSAKR